MASTDGEQINASIVQNVTDAAQIASSLVATCAHLEAVLAPIVGSMGVTALLKRSLYIAGQTHPWLLGLQDNLQGPMDLEALKSAVARQGDAEAAAAAGFILQTFKDVLTRLVGVSLTERLLQPVWERLSSSARAQDIAL